MVEYILISVAVVAVIMFLLNMRSFSTRSEPQMIDGNAHWDHGVITAVELTGEYLGMPTAKLLMDFGEKQLDLEGPLPREFADRITLGTAIEGHVEYDLLDTLRTGLWDASPEAVLTECARRLNTGTTPTTVDPRVLAFERAGRPIELCLAEDGWMLLMYSPGTAHEIAVDLRADFEQYENAHMVTRRLGILPDQAEHADMLARLSTSTLQALEDFAVGAGGWICIEAESIDLECPLPLPHADILVTFVEELVPIMAAIDQELGQEEQQGVW